MSLSKSRLASVFVSIALVEMAISVTLLASGADLGHIDSRELSSDVVKIGAIYSLEGAQSPLDLPSARGAMLAAGEINARGGINGKKIDLVLCDARSDPAMVAQCTEGLIAGNVSALVGLSDTDMVLAAAPLAQKAGIPFVTSGATSPYLAEMFDVLFLACFGDDAQAEAGALYAYEKMDLKTCSLLTDGDMEYARLLAGYFKEKYQDMGGEIVLEAFINLSDPEKLGRAVKDANADMAYLAAGPNEAGPIIQALRRGGV